VPFLQIFRPLGFLPPYPLFADEKTLLPYHFRGNPICSLRGHSCRGWI